MTLPVPPNPLETSRPLQNVREVPCEDAVRDLACIFAGFPIHFLISGGSFSPTVADPNTMSRSQGSGRPDLARRVFQDQNLETVRPRQRD